jgi:hypothetical protein
MHPLKQIWLAALDLINQSWSLPKSLLLTVKQRRERAALNALEIERLDRLRNPTKYQGK